MLCLRRMREACPHFFLTEEVEGLAPLPGERVYALPQLRRSDRAIPLLMARAAARTARCLAAERPDVIVSTGALAAVPAIVIGRLLGARVIYVESQARTTSLSRTGALARRFADAFFVQWESLAGAVPGSIYRGMLS